MWGTNLVNPGCFPLRSGFVVVSAGRNPVEVGLVGAHSMRDAHERGTFPPRCCTSDLSRRPSSNTLSEGSYSNTPSVGVHVDRVGLASRVEGVASRVQGWRLRVGSRRMQVSGFRVDE